MNYEVRRNEKIEKSTPALLKERIFEEKMKICRIWLWPVCFILFLFSVVNFLNKKDPLPMWMQIVHNVLNLTTLMSLIYSKFKGVNSI
jgi:hypothetical protein